MSSSDYPRVVLVPRDAQMVQWVQDCADGKIPFTGPGSLWEKTTAAGWSTRGLYEAVVAAEGEPK